MAAPCYESVQVCRIRAGGLTAAGLPHAAANQLYVSDAVVDLAMKANITKGANLELKNGSDTTCATYTGTDSLDSFDLTMTLCQLDVELISLLTGFTILYDRATHTTPVGFEDPAPNAASPNGVTFEAWSKTWDTNQQASSGGNNLYFNFAFPKVTWIPGDWTLQNDILKVTLTGHAVANSNAGDGPGNDWPVFGPTGPRLVFYTTSIPAASCGWQTLTAS